MDLKNAIREFDQYHQSPENRLCHYVGLPSIAMAVLGSLAYIKWDIYLLSAWEVTLDLGLVLLAITLVYDITVNWRIALGVLVAGIVIYLIGSVLPLTTLAILFIMGWLFQLTGHRRYEKNNPAFMVNLKHFYVGPRWLVNRVMRVFEVDVMDSK